MNKCLRKILCDCNETAGLNLIKQCSPQIELPIIQLTVGDEQNNRPFSITADSEFTETIKALNHPHLNL